MKKMIFLDRDGTLIRNRAYTFRVEDYELLPGVKEGIKNLINQGYYIVILTNQSGIGRGIYSEEDYQNFTRHLLVDLSSSGVEVLGVYFCPHHPEATNSEYRQECVCRKPQPGLLFQAESEHGPFDYQNSWAIGDAVRDLEMAKNKNMGIRTILLPKNYGTNDEKKMEESGLPDFKVENFENAVQTILKNL